jgi:superfamily II DNA helicase RecQ
VLAALMAAGVDRFIIDEVHTVDDWEFRTAFPAMKHTLQNAPLRSVARLPRPCEKVMSLS